MRILEINSVTYGSTGRIMLELADVARQFGKKVLTVSGKWNNKEQIINHYFIGTALETRLHIFLAIVTGLNGCFSLIGTISLIFQIKKWKPDIIHLHNLHGDYICIPLLFDYIKKNEIPVVWTLHDCWAFTGHCPYFILENCKKWESGCNHCPQYDRYPRTLFDNSQYMYYLKKRWFCGVKKLVLVTPSEWLADLVKESFLKEYPVKVIHNGIDLSTFKPTASDFREKNNCLDKFVVLGVAFRWEYRKGLDVFVELADRLGEEYQIVLVGVDEKTINILPDNIIAIGRTDNVLELVQIYSAADVFVNPTKEDNYPTVNMESIACGTPVLTFETGGSGEMIDDKTGMVVQRDNIDLIVQTIKRIHNMNPYKVEECLNKAKTFEKEKNYYEYLRLYEMM